MKRLPLFAFFLLLVPTAQAQTCDKSLMAHVYHRERLVMQRDCITVTGTVTFKRPANDGDYLYRLRLAPEQPVGLVHNKNFRKLLVFEPICVHAVKSPTAAKIACRDFHQALALPNKGDRVSVTGVLMLDTKGGWLEIHPVTSIRLLSKNKLQKDEDSNRSSSGGPLVVTLEATEGSWIRYQVDDSDPIGVALKQGQSLELPPARRQVTLSYGSLGFKMRINNREATFPPETRRFLSQVVISQNNFQKYFR
jgi:hypothetical protein